MPRRPIRCLLVCLLLSLTACLPSGPAPRSEFAELALVELPELAGCRDIVQAPAGGRLAAVCPEGVRLVSTTDGRVLEVATGFELAAWSGAGARLALAAPGAERSRLVLRAEDAGGERSLSVPGRIAGLAWLQQELYLLTVEGRHYSFGSNLAYRLHRVRGEQLSPPQTLHEITVRPSTWRQLGTEIVRRARPVEVPPGDLLVFAAYREPPAFAGYFALLAVHLETGTAWPIREARGGLGALAPGGDSATVLVGDGRGETSRVDIWTGAARDLAPLAGRSLAVSPGGRHRVIDGRWFVDGALRRELPDDFALSFAPAGDAALLRDGEGTWFRTAAFTADPRPPLDGGRRETLLKLRRWRSLGLIDENDLRPLLKE